MRFNLGITDVATHVRYETFGTRTFYEITVILTFESGKRFLIYAKEDYWPGA